MKKIINFSLKLKKIILILLLFLSFACSNAAPGDGSVDLADGLEEGQTPGQVLGGTIELSDGLVEDRMANPTHGETDSQLDDVNKLGISSGENATGILSKIVQFARESIFNLLWVIVVGVLLYIGFRLIIGRGTPDIFKKAMMGFVYLIIGVVLIFVAWAMIKIILGISI